MSKAQKYLKYYAKPSSWAPIRMPFDAILARSNIEKMGLLNRQRDYIKIRDEPRMLALHHKINETLIRSANEWDSYDYGEGYFYQSFRPIHITGLRDTIGRVEAMDLRKHLAGKTVLEIGCNTGFLALSVADVAERIDGFDINPFLIEIARVVAEYMGTENVDFQTSRFEDWTTQKRYEVVLSFANHSTYDRNTEQSIEDYFDRCVAATNPGGMLLFESHPPEHEGDGLAGVLATIEARYELLEERVLDYGGMLDRGRTYVVARLRD